MAPNFQLIADPLANRHDVTRHRSSIAAAFVPSDTTRAHFEHFPAVFLRMGLPTALHADALALFGHDSTAVGRDPKSEAQRALSALCVSHLVAPSAT